MCGSRGGFHVGGMPASCGPFAARIVCPELGVELTPAEQVAMHHVYRHCWNARVCAVIRPIGQSIPNVPRAQGGTGALVVVAAALDDAADDLRTEAAGGQEAHLAGDVRRLWRALGLLRAESPNPHLACPLEL